MIAFAFFFIVTLYMQQLDKQYCFTAGISAVCLMSFWFILLFSFFQSLELDTSQTLQMFIYVSVVIELFLHSIHSTNLWNKLLHFNVLGSFSVFHGGRLKQWRNKWGRQKTKEFWNRRGEAEQHCYWWLTAFDYWGSIVLNLVFYFNWLKLRMYLPSAPFIVLQLINKRE